MTQHDEKPSDAPLHKDSGKWSRESRHSVGYGCVHWTELELRGEEKKGAEKARKEMEVIVGGCPIIS